MKRLSYLVAGSLVLALVACNGNKERNVPEEKFVLTDSVPCSELSKQEGVKWFTIAFNRVGEKDSTVLFASYEGKTLSTNVVSIGDKAWTNLADTTSRADLDSIAIKADMFTSGARVNAILTKSKEDIEAAHKASYDEEVNQMQNAALSMLKALENDSGSFAEYCTPELASYGKKLHNDYVKKEISYQEQDLLPWCPYLGYFEGGFWNTKLSGSDPSTATVFFKAECGGEGYAGNKKITCKMKKIDGKWVVSKITEKVLNSRYEG